MALMSWVESANEPEPISRCRICPTASSATTRETRIGVAIGDQVLDLRACAHQGLLRELPPDAIEACTQESLNDLMALGSETWSALRRQLTALLAASADSATKARVQPLLVPMRDVQMQLPAQIGDYTDFYASIHHATRVGKLFRPDNPLLPNYKYVPIGYHGRASSIVVSGHRCSPPLRPDKDPNRRRTNIRPVPLPRLRTRSRHLCRSRKSARSSPFQSIEAEQHIFGLCLVNDWSARDIQSWEYQPLGPFLAKNFATTISPWIVPMEALAPYRVPAAARPEGDPAPLAYLTSSDRSSRRLRPYARGLLCNPKRCARRASTPVQLSHGNLRDLYWTLAQLLTHHASNGCNLRPGDLLATGTISGPEEGSEGCLLEMKHRAEPLKLPTGETRTFLEDGDQVIFRGYCQSPGLPRIGFGECTGKILPPSSSPA